MLFRSAAGRPEEARYQDLEDKLGLQLLKASNTGKADEAALVERLLATLPKAKAL